MQSVEPSKDFRERITHSISVAINGKNYKLRRYTIAQEIKLKNAFDGDLDKWHERMAKIDGEALVKTIHLFMDDTEDFPTWESLADKLDGTVDEKAGLIQAISLCIANAMPDVVDEVKKRTDKARSELRDQIKQSLTGLSSSTPSIKPTDGEVGTSLA